MFIIISIAALLVCVKVFSGSSGSASTDEPMTEQKDCLDVTDHMDMNDVVSINYVPSLLEREFSDSTNW